MSAHYALNSSGEIDQSRTVGACIPYLVQRDGRDYLCVMEGGAFHQFEIGTMGLYRLAAECSSRLWSMAQGAH